MFNFSESTKDLSFKQKELMTPASNSRGSSKGCLKRRPGLTRCHGAPAWCQEVD